MGREEDSRGQGRSTPRESRLGLEREGLPYGPTLDYILSTVFRELRGYWTAWLRLGSDGDRRKTKEIKIKQLSQGEQKAVCEHSSNSIVVCITWSSREQNHLHTDW